VVELFGQNHVSKPNLLFGFEPEFRQAYAYQNIAGLTAFPPPTMAEQRFRRRVPALSSQLYEDCTSVRNPQLEFSPQTR